MAYEKGTGSGGAQTTTTKVIRKPLSPSWRPKPTPILTPSQKRDLASSRGGYNYSKDISTGKIGFQPVSGRTPASPVYYGPGGVSGLDYQPGRTPASPVYYGPGGVSGLDYQPGRTPASPVYYQPGNVPATNEGIGASMWLPRPEEVRGKVGVGAGAGKPVKYSVQGEVGGGINGLSVRDWQLQSLSDMIENIRARNDELELQFQDLYATEDEENPYYYGGGYGGRGGRGGRWGGYGGSSYGANPYDFFFNLLNWRI